VRRAVILCLLISVLASLVPAAEGPTVLLYAFEPEGTVLESRMEVDSVTSHLGRRIVHGRLEGQGVVLAESVWG